MVRDAELERLWTVRNLAHERKQTAYEAKEEVSELLTAAREAMDTAYAEKQYKHVAISTSWQAYLSLRNRKRRATTRGDLASATSEALSRHEEAKCIAKEASDVHIAARRVFLSTRDKYLNAKEAFLLAEAEFRDVNTVLQDRWEPEARTIAVRVDIPSPYFGRVQVVPTPEGGYNIFFGGDYFPNGNGHGHYAIDGSGELTYKRGPREPHGAHNYLRKKIPVRW